MHISLLFVPTVHDKKHKHEQTRTFKKKAQTHSLTPGYKALVIQGVIFSAI